MVQVVQPSTHGRTSYLRQVFETVSVHFYADASAVRNALQHASTPLAMTAFKLLIVPRGPTRTPSFKCPHRKHSITDTPDSDGAMQSPVDIQSAFLDS
jgi:hypothetical protein